MQANGIGTGIVPTSLHLYAKPLFFYPFCSDDTGKHSLEPIVTKAVVYIYLHVVFNFQLSLISSSTATIFLKH